MNLYNNFYAWCQKRWKNDEVYPPTDAFKRKQISTLSGTIIEIGAGAGSNLRYLSKNVHWIGIEPNPPIINALRAEALKQGISNIDIHNELGENTQVATSSCDAAISTFVLCSVRDQNQILKQLLRVLKPGGKFIFIEHVAAEKGTLLRLYQNLTNPIHLLWAKNCHINRETLLAIQNAGFKNITLEQENIKIWGVPVPHIRGVGYKPLS